MMQLQAELAKMREERQRCANTYPDWRNDEFNCLDNQFIWGLKSKEDHSNMPPSFCTLNDIMLYYNRQHDIYYIDVDNTSGLTAEEALTLVKDTNPLGLCNWVPLHKFTITFCGK